MATYQCKVCLGEYSDPQADGSRYFHACPPLRNPDYEMQFELDKEGNRVPKGPLNPKIPRFIPRPDARNENMEMKPDGKMAAKENGVGRERLPEDKG